MDTSEYIQYKLIIKNWEKKFKEAEKRNPTKDDIKKAPVSVKDAYKRYWYTKTSLLEEAIIDEEKPIRENKHPLVPESQFEKDVLGNSASISAAELESVTNTHEQPGISSVTDSNFIASEFVNKKTVWGDHLKKTVTSTRDTSSKKSTSCQFSEKLFKGLKLKKRNPRKSINFSEKSKSFDDSPSADENSQNIPEINLSSAEQLDFSTEDNVFDSPSYVKITGGKSLNLAQPVNILNGVLDSPQTRPRLLKNKIDEGWLERCEKLCELENSTEVSKPKSIYDTRNTVSSSDEDYVYSSGDEQSETTCNAKLATKTSPLIPESMSDNVEEVDHSSVLRENVENDFSTEKSIDPVNAAKNLINSCLNNGSGKRSSSDDSFNVEKKMKTANYDSQRKIKLLEKKVASGKANENFVSIDLKRKRFVRGKRGVNYSNYKKQNWKMKKKVANMQSNDITASGSVLKCFKCGDVGHFSKQCKKKNVLLPAEEFSDTEESPFPSLEEAAAMAKAKQNSRGENNEVAEMLEMCDSIAQPNLDEDLKLVPPLCDCNDEESIKYNTAQLYQALKKFGYDTFRPGQEETMMRIISGKSALFVSSTGSGKSLCYQIPSYLYSQSSPCISVVISPLVSLMEDQVINFPSFLKAACLHTNQTSQQRDQVIEKIKQNQISVLLISPEAMVSGEHGILGRDLMKQFPPVAFVCIDEVHCVSQWSHNFRFTYLMICRVLKERFKVRTFLGLTATATVSTINSIIDHLGVPKNEMEKAISQNTVLPDNLLLTVSEDVNKDLALVRLLKQPPFLEFDSIIIYCLRRNECERLASFLRTSLENLKRPVQMFGERGALSADVEVYHAGLSAARRKKVQNFFMKGKIRIVVATVAFGMGINKSDIRGIIHYNMPKTFEHYVQEIGRAGRDGLLARCHLFFDSQGNDIPELKRHIFSNSVDRYVISKLLQKIFHPCDCIDVCKKHELAFSVEETVDALDLNQESISTLLCYLELLPEPIVKVLPPAYTICTVQSFGGVKPLQLAAKKCPPLAYAIAEHSKNSKSSKILNKYEFDVVALADKIKWKSGVVKNELKQCEWYQVNGAFRKSPVSVTFRELGFHVLSRGDLTEVQLDQALNTLHNRVISQENSSLDQLDICFKVFMGVSYKTVEDALTREDVVERDGKLKSQIRKYFVEENHGVSNREIVTELNDKPTVMCNIHRLISSHKDCNFTGRTIARIFHGIESPNYPTKIWYSSPFWRCCLNEDFNVLCRFASNELVKLRES